MEGIIEQINLRLEDMNGRMTSLENSLNASMTAIEMRMKIQIALTLVLWATIVGMLLVIMFRM